MASYPFTGVRVFVAVKDFTVNGDKLEDFKVSKGDLWFQESTTGKDIVCLKQNASDESVLCLPIERFNDSFVEINLKHIRLSQKIRFKDNDECTKTQSINGFELFKFIYQYEWDLYCYEALRDD